MEKIHLNISDYGYYNKDVVKALATDTAFLSVTWEKSPYRCTKHASIAILSDTMKKSLLYNRLVRVLPMTSGQQTSDRVSRCAGLIENCICRKTEGKRYKNVHSVVPFTCARFQLSLSVRCRSFYSCKPFSTQSQSLHFM